MRQLVYAAEQVEVLRWNHTAALMAILVNINSGKKGKAKEAIDFHPYADLIRKEQQKADDAREAARSDKVKEELEKLRRIQNGTYKMPEPRPSNKPTFRLGDFK